MLLQDRNYTLYYDDEIEGEVKHPAPSSSVGLSGESSYAKSSQQSSFNNRLRRSTFDLSVDSLSTSSSDSISCCLSSPPRKTSTLRYRGKSSSFTSSKQVSPPLPDGAASRALMKRASNQDMKSARREVRREPVATQGESDICIHKTSTKCTHGSSISGGHPDLTESFMQYFLEVIMFGCLIVPFLHLTITMERYLRSTVGELHRIVGFAFNSLSASSSSVQGLYCSSNSIENFHGTPQAIYSRSSSSSSTEDNTEGDEDGWGHFADFRDELADEASFIPSCSVMPLRKRDVAAVVVQPSCATTLETLTEGREDDDDAGEDWSF